MKKIAIFYHEDSNEWIERYAYKTEVDCTFIFFEYNTLDELYVQFEANYLFVDGILCSGQIPYFYLKRKFEDIEKPIRYFNISEQDFYQQMMLFVYGNPTFQFEHCVVDFLFQENNYLGLFEVLCAQKRPHLLVESVFSYDEEKIYERLQKKYESMLSQSNIRYCLTRLPRLERLFLHEDVQFLVFTPSIDSMQKTIYELKRDMQIDQLIQNQLVVGLIDIADRHRELEYQKITLHKLLLDFSKAHHIPMMIQRESFALKILLSYSDFLRMTHHKKHCELTQFLRESLSFQVKIGWGAGDSMPEALFHAEKAAAIRTNANMSAAYLMEKSGDVIGPLEEDKADVPQQLRTQFSTIYAETNISPVILTRMYQALQKSGSYETNATALAQYLNTTERTANRYLNKLSAHGYCTFLETRQVKLQGRPKKIYTIHFEAKRS